MALVHCTRISHAWARKLDQSCTKCRFFRIDALSSQHRMDDLAKTNLLADHIFTEPDPSAGIYIDADADTMHGRAEQGDTVPAAVRLVGHTLLHGKHPAPDGRLRPRLAVTY